MKRRLLSLTMALALCLTLLPVTALAVEVQDVPYIYYTWDKDSQTLTKNEGKAATATEVTASDTAWGGSNSTEYWYVVNNNVTIGSETTPQRVTVTGDVHLILADGCTLTVNGGIQVGENNSLTIYGQSGDTGKLEATATDQYNAAIGGNKKQTAGEITIHGGTVTATSSSTGIGGGRGGDGGQIEIYGGTVNATSTVYGAGIGGGSGSLGTGGSSGTITISGGSVIANSSNGAGIGTGGYHSGGTITITGGDVKATSTDGAGIGGGSQSRVEKITITGGDVKATSTGYGAGIGGGNKSRSINITITGGTVNAESNWGAGIGGGGAGGGDSGGSGGTIIITGGTVNAESSYGAGIGGGSGYNDGGAGTFSTGTNGNAVIFASSIQDNDDTSGWQGVIFQGNEGKVYGTSVTPVENFSIPNGKTLTIPEDKTLIIQDSVTLTNEGAITNNGTITNQGTITVEYGGTLTGMVNGKQPPQIGQPTNTSVTEGETAAFTVTVIADTADSLTYQWQQSTGGGIWSNISDGATDARYTTGTTTTSMSGYQYRCVVTGETSRVSVVTAAATLTVRAKPAPSTYTITAAADPMGAGSVTGGGNYSQGASVTLTATANEGYRFTGWMENDQRVSTDATYTFNATGDRTLTAKFERVYTVTISSTAGGTASTNKTTAAAGETMTLTATPESGYRFTGWTSSNGGTFTDASSESTTFTMPASDVTVTAQFEKAVTGVSLDKTSLSLYTGGSATLTAAVEPSDAANQNVTWQSDNANVATVEGGTVTAVGPGETTITVTTEDGGKTATCTVTVHAQTVITTQPRSQTVTKGKTAAFAVEATGDNLTYQWQQSTDNGSTWSAIDGANAASYTIQNAATGLSGSQYRCVVTGAGGSVTSAAATLTVTRPSGGSSQPSSSQQAIDKIERAEDGDVVTMDLPKGKTKLDKEVFEELAGRDVTLVLDLGGGVQWTIKGEDIPADAHLTDLDLGVTMNTSTIPVDIINAITGEVSTMQLTLAHDGDFGFTLTLTAPLGAKYAALWANLYYYDGNAEALTFQTAAQIDRDGTASLKFTHASQYVIVIDDRNHTPKDFPFVDVNPGDWYYEAVDYVFQRDLMNGTGGARFTPNGTASRAMVATILWRMAGEPQVNYAMSFADVPSGTWYTEAVRWAASEGIVTGYSDTKFGPDDPVTREQFAAMLYRYAQTLGEGFTGNWSFPLDFPDAAEVSDYAYEALCWMTKEKVLEGMEDGNLHPQSTATRAQLAAMLMRFCQAIDA